MNIGIKSALRDYQVAAVNMAYADIRARRRLVVMKLPTGAGKTKIAAAIIKQARERRKRVAFVAPYIQLIEQTVEAFGRDGITDLGVLQATHPLYRPHAPVQICSTQTLERRALRPDVDLVIVDECHRRNKHVEQWLMERDGPAIGLSATPWAPGMGKVWHALVRPITMSELIDQGFLVPSRVFAPSQPDLKKVHVRHGDYVEGELSEVCSDPTLIADIVSIWCMRAQGRPTVVFAVDCAHGKLLRAQFEQAGVRVAYIDAKTPPMERRAIALCLSNGELQVVVNIDVLTAGFDCPAVSCVVLARPTRSEIRYVQAVGRGLRIAPGKADCLILDHAGTTAQLGFVQDIAHDDLDTGEPRSGKTDTKPKEDRLPTKCPSCSYMKPAGVSTCPACGFKPEKRREIECIEGELVEMHRSSRVGERSVKFPNLSDSALLGMLRFYQQSKGYRAGWSIAKFREIRDRWPPHNVDPRYDVPPVRELASWIRSQAIRFAKSRSKVAGGRHGAA